MFDVVFLAVLLIVLIQNELPLLAAGGIAVCCFRGLAGLLADRVKFRRLELAIVVFLAYWVANYFWSTTSIDNLFSYDFLRRDGALLVTYPAFFFLLHWRLRPAYFRFFWFFFLTCLGFMAACGIAVLLNFPWTIRLESLRLVGMETEFAGSRLFYAWYQAHDSAAGVYSIASITLAAVLLEGRLKRRFKIYVWMMFLSCLAGLAFTFGRSGYLAFVAGATVLLPLRELQKAFKIALLVAVPAIALVVSNSTLLDRIDTITDPDWGTNADRFRLWRDALYDFSLSPIVGIGFGRYNDLMRQFEGVPGLVDVAIKGEIRNNSSTAHDSYLHFLAEGGIVGLAVSLYVWWCAWKELSFFERALPRSPLHPFRRAGKGALAGMFVFCIFDHSFGSGSNVLLLMSIIGTTLAASRVELMAVSKARTDIQQRAEKISVQTPIGAGQVRVS